MVTEKRPMNHAGYMSNLIGRGTTNKLYNKYIQVIKTQILRYTWGKIYTFHKQIIYLFLDSLFHNHRIKKNTHNHQLY